MPTGYKLCSRCETEKPRDEFDDRERSKDGKQVWCRDCFRDYQREYRARRRKEDPEGVRQERKAQYWKNPEKAREKVRRYRRRKKQEDPDYFVRKRRDQVLASHGLTRQEFAAMLEDQDHRCAICGSEDPNHWSDRFQVDHDHDTGEVRGLLCAKCNGGLGLLDDSPQRLVAALAYLLGEPEAAESVTETLEIAS